MKPKIFYCPDCLTSLHFKHGEAKCERCLRQYKVQDDIIYNLLPSRLSTNKIKEDEIYRLNKLDNAWYNHQVWYYLIHLSSHIVRFEKEFLPKIKGPKVLELACGNGWASLLIKKNNPQYEVYASDVSFKSLNIQGQQMSKIMEVKPNYFVVCDAEKLPFINNYFDTVFVIAALHHFLDVAKALGEIKRVLKPGGVFLGIDGMMPKIAQKLLNDEESDRAKQFGILERKITFNDWLNFMKKAKIPQDSLHLNYDTSYLHKYAPNLDEKKLIKKGWLFNVAKEIIYGAFLSKINQVLIKKLKLTSIFPAGIIIEYQKN